MKAYRIRIKGIVQGVGFRPFVYRLASEHKLKGWVLNSSAGVVIEVEGEEAELNDFARRLIEEPPPLAVIKSCRQEEIEIKGFSDFVIRRSEKEDSQDVMISPDIAICADCRREVLDPDDRRYHYPFTNCTNCGPRFTIIKDVPYDRAMTTMAAFPMCDQCRQEYENPRHRRFHAQPNACPDCGPHTSLLDPQGRTVDAQVTEMLKAGYVVAVKGLGGFHLAVDAHNAGAVAQLRCRKHRDKKPFAVMVRNVEVAKQFCHVSPLEEKWLTSPQAPIVILHCREEEDLPAEYIHPGIDTLGVMLPYTPLHFLLFADDLDILIMTSANITDEPLITDNRQALQKLAGVADFFLVHNRDIYNPCDDSVMMVSSLDTPQLLRRARGFVPRGIELPVSADPVLATGGEMKNTFCLTRDGEAFLSQHWGDLNHYNNYLNYQHGIERFKKMLSVEPRIIAHDLHPDYQTTRWAQKQTGLPQIAVQHHWAHMAAAMADNSLTGEVLGLICDGTGWGTDGAVWGCEVLRGDYHQFTRLAHLQYVPLPGGDVSARKPYRMAAVYLCRLLQEQGMQISRQRLPLLQAEEAGLLQQLLSKPGSSPLTSSCGRLFDAVSALLGICMVNQYEGQAAMELEARADKGARGIYGYTLSKQNDMWIMEVMPLWQDLLAEIDRGRTPEVMSQRFHLTLAVMFTDLLDRIRSETGLNRVVLSGGVFHNQLLLFNLYHELVRKGFQVFQHRQVPPGDGGLSLGQAVIASALEL